MRCHPIEAVDCFCVEASRGNIVWWYTTHEQICMLVELEPSSGFRHGVADVKHGRDSGCFQLMGVAPLQ